MITIRASEGEEFAAYLALPEGGEGPGLVLLQEIFGVNRAMRTIADWYAARGFVVACPDLFWRQEPGVQLTDDSDEEWQHALELYQGLDEARAVKPRPVRMRAEPASHAFAIKNAPGPWCSARNWAAFSA